MTDIRNPHDATDEETGNIIKKSAVAELCGANAELIRSKVLAENSATFSMNSLVVFRPNCWDIIRNVADPHHGMTPLQMPAPCSSQMLPATLHRGCLKAWAVAGGSELLSGFCTLACCWGSFGGSSPSPAAQPNSPNRLGCPCGANAELIRS